MWPRPAYWQISGSNQGCRNSKWWIDEGIGRIWLYYTKLWNYRMAGRSLSNFWLWYFFNFQFENYSPIFLIKKGRYFLHNENLFLDKQFQNLLFFGPWLINKSKEVVESKKEKIFWLFLMIPYFSGKHYWRSIGLWSWRIDCRFWRVFGSFTWSQYYVIIWYNFGTNSNANNLTHWVALKLIKKKMMQILKILKPLSQIVL